MWVSLGEKLPSLIQLPAEPLGHDQPLRNSGNDAGNGDHNAPAFVAGDCDGERWKSRGGSAAPGCLAWDSPPRQRNMFHAGSWGGGHRPKGRWQGPKVDGKILQTANGG